MRRISVIPGSPHGIAPGPLLRLLQRTVQFGLASSGTLQRAEGSAGHFDVPLPASANRTIEPRSMERRSRVRLVSTFKLPTREDFPQTLDGRESSVRALFEQVCRYMDVDPRRVELVIDKEVKPLWLVDARGELLPPYAAGLYEERGDHTAVIHVSASELGEPPNVIGTMAHELSHLRLLNDRRLDGSAFDNELLTDLNVVFHGLGVFLANSPRAWRSGFTRWPGTDLLMPDYLTLPMYGDAQAHAAWLRDDQEPVWPRYLRPDAKACFRHSLRFLRKTEDSPLLKWRRW